MDIDKFEHKEKYIIGLNDDNIEELFLKKNVKYYPIKICLVIIAIFHSY